MPAVWEAGSYSSLSYLGRRDAHIGLILHKSDAPDQFPNYGCRKSALQQVSVRQLSKKFEGNRGGCGEPGDFRFQ